MTHDPTAPPGGRSGIQVIARAAAILRVLREDTGGLSLGQIAERVGLPRSTVQRIAGALQAERLVIATGAGGSLKLGPEIVALGRAARFDVVDRCRPHLVALAARTGETVDLSVLRAEGMVFLDQVAGTHRLRAVSSVGEIFPVTSTANGRACLALLAPLEARWRALAEWGRSRRVPGRAGPGAAVPGEAGQGAAAPDAAAPDPSGPAPAAPPTGDITALMARLAAVRRTGIAEDLDEHTEGISALGFAFRDQSGDCHAISVPVPSARFARRREGIEAELLLARARVAAAIGLPEALVPDR